MNWNHKSIKALINETDIDDPIEAIRYKARNLVLKAYELGWSGPPFNPSFLAKLLKIDILPNDNVVDARIINTQNKGLLIEYNPFQKSERINFSLSHEIGHALFTDCRDSIRNRESDRNENNWELEFLCNVAASELLLPYAFFSEEVNKVDLNIEELIKIANKYSASLEAVFLRVTEVSERPCAVIFSHFETEKKLIVDYFKTSKTFEEYEIKKEIIIPKYSIAYECISPGWTSRGNEQWSIFENKNMKYFCIGLGKLRKEKKQRVAIFISPDSENDIYQDHKIHIEYGDATKPRGEGIKIISQIINTSGGMGFGFGKSLSKNYPVTKKKLEEWKLNKGEFKLGKTNYFYVDKDIIVFQMLAQEGLFPKNNIIPLRYSSLQKCLTQLAEISLGLNASVHMPQIGAGQAKGDWNIIQGMLYDELISKGIKVIVYLLPGISGYNSKLNSRLTLFDEANTWQKEK